MSEEEILYEINYAVEKAKANKHDHIGFKIEYIQGLLDLYNKQKQEAEHYKAENSIRHKCLFNIAEKVGITKSGITESMIINAIDNNYISKDKVLKAIGYEENDEEYDRLKQDNEKLLAILDTLYSEVCRLEDIEDQKVSVAVSFIEEKRDKYWQDKIEKELLEPINKERQETYKEFMKKGKDDYHGIEGSVLQELNWVVGTIEELLGE